MREAGPSGALSQAGLVVVLAVLAQPGAGAIDLIAAQEVRPHAIGGGPGEDLNGQLVRASLDLAGFAGRCGRQATPPPGLARV